MLPEAEKTACSLVTIMLALLHRLFQFPLMIGEQRMNLVVHFFRWMAMALRSKLVPICLALR